MVRKDTVNLFRHFPVVAAQPGFHMGDRDMQLGRCKRTGKGGIGVAIDHQHVRLLLKQDLFNLHQHSARLFTVITRTYAKIIGWFWKPQLLKEYFRHSEVIVLAGVDENFGDGV